MSHAGNYLRNQFDKLKATFEPAPTPPRYLVFHPTDYDIQRATVKQIVKTYNKALDPGIFLHLHFDSTSGKAVVWFTETVVQP